MTPIRPDPDALLAKIQKEDSRAVHGRLKIFFGGCAGVGKTYAMLSVARQRLAEGIDVVAGVVETHGRTETLKMLEGIPVLPLLEITHKGIALKEFDLENALKRKPAIILMDELAHTNAIGSRHQKRWNDVEELLANGMDVYTTLNVQHLESLSDLVAGTTGVWVKETVPDSVFDNADDIVLVDINADELLTRLNSGKVYVAQQARARAADNFFKKSNIIALRELALRRTTERVDAQMDAYKYREGIQGSQPITDKIVVCIGTDNLSEKLIRTAKRMATSLKAPWVAVYVENARHYRLTDSVKKQVQGYLQQAERLGAKVLVLQGTNAIDEIISYAHNHNVTKIIVGKRERTRWRNMLLGSLADKIIHKSSYVDVYIVTGPPHKTPTKPVQQLYEFRPLLYGQALAIIIICTLIGISFRSIIKPADQMLIYLIGNIIASAMLGRITSFFYAFLSAACLNFFFIEPLYTLEIYDRSYWLTLIVMLATSLVINSYAAKLKIQAFFARRREQETQMLYDFAREIAATRGHNNIALLAEKHIKEATGFAVSLFLPDADTNLHNMLEPLHYRDIIKENGLMQWCYDNKKQAGIGTDTMPSAQTFYLPLLSADTRIGVLGIIPQSEDVKLSHEQLVLVETFASVLASAIERANAAEIAEKLKVDTESEKLRNTLLSSVSHDLRTPLASITGASGTLAMDYGKLAPETVQELARSINQEAARLSRIVSNLLDLTIIESGNITLNKHPYLIEELVGSALQRLENTLSGHMVITNVAENLPVILIDGVLIEQLISNLLENAAKYTPSGSTITITVIQENKDINVSIADNGAGIKPGDEQKIFDKFYTAGQNIAGKGTGLGLAICQGIVKAHNGTIRVENSVTGGACFSFMLPVDR